MVDRASRRTAVGGDMNKQKLMAEILKGDVVVVMMNGDMGESVEVDDEQDEDWPEDGYKAKLERAEKAKKKENQLSVALKAAVEDHLTI